MDIAKIVLLLKNAGLQNITVGNGFIEFDNPSCLYTAFDNFLEIAWVIILALTGIMLFGWAVLYIKNGVKINNLFNNAKTVILILCILSLVKPIVNMVYGDNLFGRNCDRKQVSLSTVQELLQIRNKTLSGLDEDSLYEIFDIVDSGRIIDSENQYETNYAQSFETITTDTTNNSTTNDSFEEIYTQNTNGVFIKATYSNSATIYVDANGQKIKRSGGSAAWRNNNPGNIRKSKNSYKLGAIGETDKWAVFPSEEAGLNAIVKLLRSDSYRNLSVAGAIHRWAPFSDGNNPDRYARRVSKMTGLSANAKINTLNDTEIRKVADAIKIVEGWKPGREEKM